MGESGSESDLSEYEHDLEHRGGANTAFSVSNVNAVILDQREELERLTRRVNVMLTRLETLEAAAPGPEVTKPPHY